MAERAQLLEQIQETEFQIDDLVLYLDTHPLDNTALDTFKQVKNRRYELLQDYAKKYEPLNQYLVCPDTNNESSSWTEYPDQRHFTWTDGPLPWDCEWEWEQKGGM